MGSVLNSEVAGQWNTFGLFGEVNASIAITPTMSPVMYAWQGLRYDPITGDYDNLARQYNQDTGTFTSQDPSGFESGEINLYRSRKGNPLRYVDLNGLSAADVEKIINQYNRTVKQLTDVGDRIDPGPLNNFDLLPRKWNG